MKWFEAIREGTALGCMFIVLAILIVKGVFPDKTLVIQSFGEQYLEIPLVFIGIICYLKYHKIKFRFKRS